MEKLEEIAVKIVGFRVGNERAVYYKKLETPNDKEFGCCMNIAFHDKKCDFVSVRKVKACPICGVKHKETTKIFMKHQKWLALLKQGKLPCQIPGLWCRSSLCDFHNSNPLFEIDIGENGVCNYHLSLVIQKRAEERMTKEV